MTYYKIEVRKNHMPSECNLVELHVNVESEEEAKSLVSSHFNNDFFPNGIQIISATPCEDNQSKHFSEPGQILQATYKQCNFD